MAKILVIDDDDFVRGMVVSVLRKVGHEVAEATNGTDGIVKAKFSSPDLVITDMLMPDKEGIETILELKAICPSMKIIAMSGGGQTKNMTFLEMAKKVGAHRVLQKPFKPSALVEAINALLGE